MRNSVPAYIDYHWARKLRNQSSGPLDLDVTWTFTNLVKGAREAQQTPIFLKNETFPIPLLLTQLCVCTVSQWVYTFPHSSWVGFRRIPLFVLHHNIRKKPGLTLFFRLFTVFENSRFYLKIGYYRASAVMLASISAAARGTVEAAVGGVDCDMPSDAAILLLAKHAVE